MGGVVNGHAEVNGEFSIQMLQCLGLSDRLPGCGGQVDHFLAAPSVPRGSWKVEIWSWGPSCNARALLKHDSMSVTVLEVPGMCKTHTSVLESIGPSMASMRSWL